MNSKNSLIALMLLSLVAISCGKVETRDKDSRGSFDDITKPQPPAEAIVSKGERIIRKLRLSEQILAVLGGFSSESLDACVPATERANLSTWQLSCGNTKGVILFTRDTSNAVTEIEAEVKTVVQTTAGEKVYIERLVISNLSQSTMTDGKLKITYRMDWDLYENVVSTSTLICDANSLPLTLTAQQTALTLANSRLSVTCKTVSQIAGSSMTLELDAATLNFDNQTHQLTGAIGYRYSDSGVNKVGQLTLNTLGLQSSDGNSLAWQCNGSALCFP